jgi:uncharacterized protein YciI
MLSKAGVAIVAGILLAGIVGVEAQPSPLFVVHFETGPNWNKSLTPAEQPGFREHSANLNRLRKEGAIVFGARYEELGMIFLEAESLEAARAIVDADPGVRSGAFVARVATLQVFYPWER